MKKPLLVLVLGVVTTFASCTKEEPCNCTYYSEERTSANLTWRVTYESPWDYCEAEDFGYSTFTHSDGSQTQTHTFVTCK